MPDLAPDPIPSRWRRVLRTLLGCVVAGTIVQALAGWAILFAAHGVPHVVSMTAAEVAKPLDVPQIVNPDRSTSGPPFAEMGQDSGPGWLVDFSRARVSDSTGTTYWGQTGWVYCGWPVPSLDAHWGRIASDGTWPDQRTAYSGPDGCWVSASLERSPAGVTITLLPWHPIWRGMLINTAVFAGAFLLAIVVFRWLTGDYRRAKAKARTSAGLCISCAYPLHDLPRCPECGRLRETLAIALPTAEQPPPETETQAGLPQDSTGSSPGPSGN